MAENKAEAERVRRPYSYITNMSIERGAPWWEHVYFAIEVERLFVLQLLSIQADVGLIGNCKVELFCCGQSFGRQFITTPQTYIVIDPEVSIPKTNSMRVRIHPVDTRKVFPWWRFWYRRANVSVVFGGVQVFEAEEV